MVKKLYKYTNFDLNGYYKSILYESKLYCTSPKNFNDPFDCKIYPNYQLGNNNDILNKFIEHTYVEFPNLSRKDILKIAKDKFKTNIKIIKNPNLMSKRMEDIINKTFGIYSLSESNDNLLMWAHYAKDHRGFCVEFNVEMLFKVLQNHILINEFLMLKKVKYTSEYPIINPYVSEYKPEDFFDLLTTKSKDWKYENEWRIIYSEHPNEFLKIPEEIITAIYFGVRCNKNDISETISLLSLKKHTPNFYKAKLKMNRFGIEYERIKKV